MESFITEKFGQLLQDVLSFIDPAEYPSRVIAVVPGAQTAWDDCCEGQLTCRLVSMNPVLNEGGRQSQCGIKYWAAVGEVQLLRCSQALNEDGTAPSPLIVAAEGSSSMRDTDSILKGIAQQSWISSMELWTPEGPNGGCRGVQVQFNFALDQPA